MEATDYNVKEVLRSLETIESSVKLSTEFRKQYGTDFDMIRACIKDNFIKKESINLIKKLAPICYKIGGKIFLKGDEIKNNGEIDKLTELFDMTTEMESGHSYSFYVSSTGYFELASCDEIIEVKKFLSILNQPK